MFAIAEKYGIIRKEHPVYAKADFYVRLAHTDGKRKSRTMEGA